MHPTVIVPKAKHQEPKAHSINDLKQKRKQDALALAYLVYDMFNEVRANGNIKVNSNVN